MGLEEKVKELSAEQSKYNIYYLRKNPFPAKPISPYYDPEQVADAMNKFCESARKDELDFITNKFIKPAYDESESMNIWLEGDVGVGKSAILIRCWDALRKRDDVVAIYAPIYTGLSSNEFYKGWVRELGIDFFEDLAYRLLQKAFLERSEQLLTHLKPEIRQKVKKKLEDAVKEDYTILRGVFYPVKKSEIPQIRHIDKNELSKQFEYWLASIPGITCKQLVSSARGRRAILPLFLEDPAEAFKNLLDLYPPRYAVPVLQDIILLTDKAGYVMTYLFLDQLDFQWERAGWSKAKKDKIILQMRTLAAEVLGKLAIATTTYPHLSPTLRADPDLMATLPMTPERVCTVSKLSKQTVREVFATYLSVERTKTDVPELLPFTVDAIDEITSREMGNTRNILIAAHDILSRAADEKVKQISKDYVTKYYATK
jgi:hypothetical protein